MRQQLYPITMYCIFQARQIYDQLPISRIKSRQPFFENIKNKESAEKSVKCMILKTFLSI
jgi:hypothetical protein